MPFESAQGLSFTFSGTAFEIMSLSFSKKVSEVDTSTLKTKHGDFRSYRPAPLRDGDELQVEFMGISGPQMTATGAISWTFDGSGSNAALTAGLPTVALCTSSSLSASAGELVKGSATFRITQN
jgi:hypothetical protein